MKQSTPRAPSTDDRALSLEVVLADLVADGLLSREQADPLLPRDRGKRRLDIHPLVVIAERSLTSAKAPHKPLSLELLSQWLAGRAGLEYKRIDPLKIDVAATTALVPYAYAARNKILPLAVSADKIMIATAEPFLRGWQRELEHALRQDIVRVIANPLDITRYLVEFYSLSRSVKKATSSTNASALPQIANLEQLVELGRAGRLDADDHHIVTIVDWLLQYAFEQRASDIHLEPRREQGNVRFRIDGVLHTVYQMPPAVMAAVTSRLKILGRMDVAEKRRPLDGRLKMKTAEGKELELRLATLPTAFGEKLVMRIFDPEVVVRSYGELGFADSDLERWEGMVRQPHGVILVTGPTGSGKTTTLYTTLRQLAVSDVNVCTIEDPIEMVEPNLNQMQVQHNIGLDFAAGVRALLRQDPDIIMVGEIRDRETAEMACQAALTGHLVLSTLHTNDAPSAVIRLLDLGIPPYLISATVLGVLAQRLVRSLCPHCKETVALDESAWRSLVQPWKMERPTHAQAPKGCLECRNTGYRGRVGLYEILVTSPQIRKLIEARAQTAALRNQAVAEGMRPLRISGAQKVHAGVTSLEEVSNVALWTGES